jgi:phenylalanyl-tRNA synthetase beta subunit
LNIPELRDVHLMDLYRGPKLPIGKISLTVRLTFANLERTLTQDEANLFSRQVFAELSSRFGVEARS